MPLQLGIHIGAGLALALVVGLIAAPKRLGELNTASWLVVVGVDEASARNYPFARRGRMR